MTCTTIPFGAFWKRNSRPVVGAAISEPEHKGKFMSESENTLSKENPSVKLIPLTQGKFAIVDAADYESLSKHKWCAWTPDGKTFYAKRGGAINGKEFTEFMHVVVFGSKNVDHKDGNGLNNRRLNLRQCTKSQNGANRGLPSNNRSGFKGVYWFKPMRTWKARLTCQRKEHHLGYFKNPSDAARAYDACAILFFGEFAKTNQSLGLLT